MINQISVLGSTGSIGRQTLASARHLGVRVCAIAANSSVKLLEEQAREFNPELVSVYDEKSAKELKTALSDTDIRVVSGKEGLLEAAVLPAAEAVITAVSGSIGLEPTLLAIKEKKRIGLANKETLVCAGKIVMKAASEHGAEIIPVDSEHSAIFQSLHAGRHSQLNKILLTASGGPFRGMLYKDIYYKTPSQALAHPNWTMGAKISIDSATMMNKGLEVIEAMHLFNASLERIEVLIHPESILHSAVEFCDGAVVAQLGVPDMTIPIQLALTYPDRFTTETHPLDLCSLNGLHFFHPELSELPCLAMALECARIGGNAPCVMSAANEVAVHMFLREKITFGQIYEYVRSAVDSVPFIEEPDIEQLLESDFAARQFVRSQFDA